nr:MAG TPA: hypothetical protein [Caudoviricetes sp.]
MWYNSRNELRSRKGRNFLLNSDSHPKFDYCK